MSDPVVKTLQELDLFAGATSRELRSVADLGTFVDVPTNRVLSRQGAVVEEFVVVVDGVVVLSRYGKTTAILCAGEAWGEIPPSPRAFPHTATAATRTAATLLVYSRREYKALLARSPTVANVVAQGLEHKMPSFGWPPPPPRALPDIDPVEWEPRPRVRVRGA